MKIYALFLLPSLFFLVSCLSEGETPPPEVIPEERVPEEPSPAELVPLETPVILEMSTYSSSPAPDPISDIPTDLPLPGYEIVFYPYLPLGKEAGPISVDVALPPYRQAPQIIKPKPAAPVKPKVEKIPEVELPPPAAEKELREERYSPGTTVPLVLEGTDWIFMGEESRKNPGFKERTVLLDRTLFTFAFPEAFTYVLLFHRQNNSTGDTEQEKIRVIIEAEPALDREASPPGDLIEKESGRSMDTLTPETLAPAVEKAPEAEAKETEAMEAEARLELIEENPARAEESLYLLEYLLKGEAADGDRDTLAGYYYRMARLLEMNSSVQDLKKAYDTYVFITDQFFLTDYYELSEERIRFLDRHFFKLR